MPCHGIITKIPMMLGIESNRNRVWNVEKVCCAHGMRVKHSKDNQRHEGDHNVACGSRHGCEG